MHQLSVSLPTFDEFQMVQLSQIDNLIQRSSQDTWKLSEPHKRFKYLTNETGRSYDENQENKCSYADVHIQRKNKQIAYQLF